MSGYLTLVYVILLVSGAITIIFFNEVHVGYLQPLQSEFTTEPDLDTYGDLFMSALIPMAYFIGSTLWYITAIQRRRNPYA